MNEEKAQVISTFGKDPKDSGSTAVQIALLTGRIQNLSVHFEKHSHDFGSNRGLLKLIGKRRSLSRYMQKKDPEKYKELIAKLGLRK